ncbi:Phosphatidic acid phosphatase type 2/haloperoxidase domain-containing protein [Caenorhabditis elegans]|uniref:Phosphatidic acid phosphatase type 2/haloperoxidase domain-containing protein n=1 Tax=Caenorhabditis elegans TaxID=6239 RepID=Q19403_CAEEL|nr:Phosphatidic acid phosphatase type 2/haloperoxidase domain-containing protein [Caenorhabditis elegans]CAA92120.2 Phosphatidic acid phosphatase type 2/haloperoxidase domain-containing protein [Caenorhabditis elegans]|eukprot:NP_509790.2 PhosphoLipid PhosPhatase homolog [Caenorhabditis elegans]
MSERALRRTTFSGRLLRFKEEEEEIDRKTAIVKGGIYMALDIVIVLGISCSLFLWFSGSGINPYERAMPCGDISIQQPFKENTVGLKHLLVITLGSPFLIVALVEAILHFKSKGSNRLAKFFSATTITYLKYLLMYAACTFAMEFLKCYVGRLRPHFFSVCKPDWSKVDCTDKQSFIDSSDLVCTNPNPRKIRTARTSFPSGHTAAAFHVFLFVYIYLRRMAENTGIKEIITIRNILVPSYALWTVFCAVTRVTDNWHFPTDVLGGVILAVVFIIPAFYSSWTTTEMIYKTRKIEPGNQNKKTD